MAYVDNDIILMVYPSGGSKRIRFYDLSATDGSTIAYNKSLLFPDSIASYPNDPVYLENNKVLFNSTGNSYVFDISAVDGSTLTPEKTYMNAVISGILYR